MGTYSLFVHVQKLVIIVVLKYWQVCAHVGGKSPVCVCRCAEELYKDARVGQELGRAFWHICSLAMIT